MPRLDVTLCWLLNFHSVLLSWHLPISSEEECKSRSPLPSKWTSSDPERWKRRLTAFMSVLKSHWNPEQGAVGELRHFPLWGDVGYQEGEEFKFIIVSLEKPLSVSAPMHQLKALVPLRLPEENSVTRNGLPSYELLARDAPDIPQTL